MFGIAVARLDAVTDEEKERYQALYCGLCLALKRRYGQISRAALSYDLAFLVMLYDSLWEPPEESGFTRCIAHPRKKTPFAVSRFSDYCADLSVALAYNKCLDDVADDHSAPGRAAAAALGRSYRACVRRLPQHTAVIADAMETVRALERDPKTPPDAVAEAFGQMMGFLFQCVPGRFPDLWSDTLNELGYWLGRFICLMDAAIDYRADARSGAYNPFVETHPAGPDPVSMRVALSVLAGNACRAFERLPCVQDAHLLRSVLYAGLWQKFNQEYDDRPQGNGPSDGAPEDGSSRTPDEDGSGGTDSQGRVE